MDIALKSPSELPGRLGLAGAASLLMIGAPESLERLLSSERARSAPARSVPERALRTVKERFAAVLLWREDRVGSHAAVEAALERLETGGVFWVVVAMRKVTGPSTPAVHRLDLSDLRKMLGDAGLVNDRELRISAWHVAYRFRKQDVGGRT